MPRPYTKRAASHGGPESCAGARDGVGEAIRSVVMAVGLLIFAAGMTWIATDFGPEARRLPLVVGVPLTVMAVLNLIFVLREALGFRSPQLADVKSSGTGDDDVRAQLRLNQDGAEADQGLGFAPMMLALAVVIGLFLLFGLAIATIVFTLGYMRFVGREPWAKSLAITGMTLAMFYAFHNFLNVRLYHGYLASEDLIPYVLPF